MDIDFPITAYLVQAIQGARRNARRIESIAKILATKAADSADLDTYKAAAQAAMVAVEAHALVATLTAKLMLELHADQDPGPCDDPDCPVCHAKPN